MPRDIKRKDSVRTESGNKEASKGESEGCDYIDVGLLTTGRPSIVPTLLSLLGQPVKTIHISDNGKQSVVGTPMFAQTMDLFNRQNIPVILYRKQFDGIGYERDFIQSKCETEFYLSLDDDIIVLPGAIELLVNKSALGIYHFYQPSILSLTGDNNKDEGETLDASCGCCLFRREHFRFGSAKDRWVEEKVAILEATKGYAITLAKGKIKKVHGREAAQGYQVKEAQVFHLNYDMGEGNHARHRRDLISEMAHNRGVDDKFICEMEQGYKLI